MRGKDWLLIVLGFGLVAGVGIAALAHKQEQQRLGTVTDRITSKVNHTQAAENVAKLEAAQARLKAALEREAAREEAETTAKKQ